MVEHTANDGTDATAEREALLATSLSHPNIISTYKICTVHSSTGQAGGGTSSGSPTGSNPNSGGPPAAPSGGPLPAGAPTVGALGSNPGSAGRLGRTASGSLGRPPLHPGSNNMQPVSPHGSRGRRGQLPAMSPGREGAAAPPVEARGKAGAMVDSAEQNAGHSGRSSVPSQARTHLAACHGRAVDVLCMGACS